MDWKHQCPLTLRSQPPIQPQQCLLYHTLAGSLTSTVSEKSATMISPTILNKITDVRRSLLTTTSAVIHTTSLILTTLGTTVLRTVMSGTQEGETIAVPQISTTTLAMSTLSETHHTIATDTFLCSGISLQCWYCNSPVT